MSETVGAEAAAWAIRLFLGREPMDAAEIQFHTAHPHLASLRSGFVRTCEFREFYDDLLQQPGPGGAGSYAAPLWLLSPPTNPEIAWRFEPPTLAAPVCQLCTDSQFDEPIYAEWCRIMGAIPVRHRKQWEFCWELAAMEAAGVLQPGRRALGFGTGREAIPSVLAMRGLSVVASDAPSELVADQGWGASGQHTDDLMHLHMPHIVDEEVFRRQVSFRPVDMNAIDPDLRDFDLCWSSCCFEHLGSVEHGLRFVENSLETLRPGGVAIHTTEFNLSSNKETLDIPGLCLYRRQDIENLLSRLSAAGHEVWPLNLYPGHTLLDAHVDLPPYSLPHLKLDIARFTTTSRGLVVRRAT